MQPTAGRIVLYKLHAQDAEQVNRRRADFAAFSQANRHPGAQPSPGHPGRSGHIGHYGNQVSEGDVLPAVVVRTFGGSTVNLQVLLDGNDSYWATSRPEGDQPGQWAWPAREPAAAAAPKIGDIVHYLSHGTPVREDGTQAYTAECRAAVITELTDIGGPYTDPEVIEGLPMTPVVLCVLNPSGMFFHDAELDEDATRGGTWHPAGYC